MCILTDDRPENNFLRSPWDGLQESQDFRENGNSVVAVCALIAN